MAPVIHAVPLDLKAAPQIKKTKTKIKEVVHDQPPVSPWTSELPTPEQVKPVVDGSLGQQALAVAMQYMGWPYVGDGSTYGGTSPADGGFDCSGLVQWAYSQVGISLPRTSSAQAGAGWEVGYDDLRPGDIVVVSGGGHVGLYAGNGQIINAPSPGQNITLSPINWFPIYALRRVG
jgi:cell wall-associated NlpC family hydrolase